ncbi:small multi-drug export protein [Marinobacter hydrocarbonoclasticus]|uniref:small multi-drug export protein n=1 Tax=Marinobacter nauticus TaxID=2743 RepID=UPI001C95A80E|nr:small multi-drug export protein [Marinobacter nauticus]MBY6193740.1 small multi-drug export protein [Marinobacter nauticus]MBY6214888.1 small multi-drug export protein [Marinobacter nauticus]
MNEFMLYLSVFVGAAIPVLEVWIAVPLGVIAGLPWFPAAIAGFVGNLVSLLPVIYASEKVSAFVHRWLKRSKPTENEEAQPLKTDRKHRILEKFGVPGLAFLGPFLIGVHAAAAFAIGIGAARKNVLGWFTLSLLVCSLLFGFLAGLGITELSEDKQLPFSGVF